MIPRSSLPPWLARFTASVVAADITAVVVSSALYAWWGTAALDTLLVGTAVVTVLTALALLVARAWVPGVLGQGTTEFARLSSGMAGAAVAIGLAGLALDLPQARPWVFGVLPVACVLAASARMVLRAGLHRRRRAGEAMRSVLAVGSVESVAALVARTDRARHEGFAVTAVCVPDGVTGQVAGVPVVGSVEEVEQVAAAGGFDVVSVGRSPGWTSSDLRRLAWSLESSPVELVVDPGLMEIAGPRLHTAAIDGMPLLQLTEPRFTGLPWVIKSCFDRAGALGLLVLLSPLLLAVAVAVRRDGGPVFFRQLRVGADGREFRMVKFRSMVVDAEARLAALAAANEGSGPLFKMRADPRVTRVGAVLRRYSLDELPQLFNVLCGSMSLVGPRPPLPTEVAVYERAAQRRLLVKPGMTGLWQVSGRSDLSWEESVRLDLRYVENWTFALDLQILVRTVRAVRGGGAY